MSIAPGTIDPGAPHFPPGEGPGGDRPGLCDPDYMPYFAQYHATCQCWPQFFPPGTDCWLVEILPPPTWYLLEALICNPGDPQEEWVAQPNAICARPLHGMSVWAQSSPWEVKQTLQAMPVPMPETWAFFIHSGWGNCVIG